MQTVKEDQICLDLEDLEDTVAADADRVADTDPVADLADTATADMDPAADLADTEALATDLPHPDIIMAGIGDRGAITTAAVWAVCFRSLALPLL